MDLEVLGLVATASVVTGSVIAACLSLWGKVFEEGMQYLSKAIFVKKEMNDSFTAGAITGYLKSRHKHVSFFTDERFDGQTRKMLPLGEEKLIFFEQVLYVPYVFIYRGAPILFLPRVEGTTAALGSPGRFISIRGTVDWRRLLVDVGRWYDEEKAAEENDTTDNSRYCVRHLTGQLADNDDAAAAVPPDDTGAEEGMGNAYVDFAIRPLNYSADQFWRVSRSEAFENVSLTPAMQQVMDDVEFWYHHKDWYEQRAIPWRRGFLLYGPPGTGKTTLVRAIAQKYDLPVFVMDLQSMTSQDFRKAWATTRRNRPRVVLFEDFDNVFIGRNNPQPGGVTFDTILNTFDGVERDDGLLLVVTTNHVDSIDPALGVPDASGRSTRPGRIDLVVAMDGIDRAGKMQIAMRILGNQAVAERVVDEGVDDSPAQLQERCIRTALDLLYKRGQP